MTEIRLPRYLPLAFARMVQKCRFKLACLVVLVCLMALHTPGWNDPQSELTSITSHWLETANTADQAGYSIRAVSIDERLGEHIADLAQGDIHGAAGHIVVLYCLDSSPPCAYVYTPVTLKDIEREQSFTLAGPLWGALPAPHGSR